MKLLDDYRNALLEIYKHISFVEEWRVYPIDDCSEKYWYIKRFDEIVYFDTRQDYESNNESHKYSNDIINRGVVGKGIFRGELFTGILADTNTDGNKFLSIFDNEKEMPVIDYEF